MWNTVVIQFIISARIKEALGESCLSTNSNGLDCRLYTVRLLYIQKDKKSVVDRS